MKSGFFKYIFIIFVIGIIIFAIYTLYFKENNEENNIVENIVSEEMEVRELRLGISNYDSINPLISSNKEVLNVEKLIFEPLVKINENYEIELCLATECSKISETSYIVKIDNNIKWHDSSALIAKDIQFTIDRLKEGKSVYSYNVEKVTSVEILDADTIRINLSEEVPFFEYNLTFPILPNNYYINEDFHASTKTPIGTGMYKIDSIESGNIILSKNEKWWNKNNIDAKIETINIKLYSEIGELYNAFKLGNIDVFSTSNLSLEQYIGTIGYTKQEYKGRNFDYMALNCQNNILLNTEVRQAINYAIDKNNLISSVYNNEAYTSEFPLDYGNYLYNDNISSQYSIENAKKVLTDNGWEFKNNTWQKTENYKTKKLSLTITVNQTNETRVAVAENIKSQLEQVGIKITINKVSDSNYKTILENKSYEMIITGIYNSYTPSLNTFLGANNLQNYQNDEITSLLKEVNSITDKATLKQKYNRIIEIYNQEIPFVSLYRNKNTVVKNQSLAGELKPNNYFSYYKLGDWYLM